MSQYSILVVDDEARIRSLLRTKLEDSGYQVLEACDGIEALDCVHGRNVDLILLDLVMPRMNGFETLRELRVFSKVPVIIITGNGDYDRRSPDLRGADDLVGKPFSLNDLIDRIEGLRRRDSSVSTA